MTAIRRSAWIVAAVIAILLHGAAGAEPPESNSFRIGPGDQLAIMVWDNKDLDYQTFVRPDGKISVPLVGEIQAAGRTVAELTTALTEEYSKTIRSPHVMVDIRQIVSRPVYFIGGLGKGGAIQLLQDLTLVQGISRAGGLAPEANLEAAVLVRSGKQIPVDFVRLIEKADLTQDIQLEPGDTIIIPTAEMVTVMGQVKSPSSFKFTSELTMVQAIVQAGGFTPLAAPKRVILLRGDGLNRESLKIDVDAMMRRPESVADIPLKAKDIIIVPERWF